MMQWISNGGIFMTPMTLLALLMAVVAARVLYTAYTKNSNDGLKKLNLVVLQLGVFIFFLGVLSHVMGLVQVLSVLENVSGVSPTLIAGGMRIALIAPLYGLVIFLLGWGLWSVARYKIST